MRKSRARRPCTFTAELVAPVEVGAATILVEALRIGSGVSTIPGATDGYLVEYRELRGVDGRLVALNQQTFVAIR